MFLFELIAFIVVLIVPGYLVADKYFSGLEKAVLSVFLSLSITSFLFYVVVSFFGILKEFIYFYALLALIVFFVFKKNKIRCFFDSFKKIKFKGFKSGKFHFFEFLILFLLIFFLVLAAFFIQVNKSLVHDDETYHLPIINDIADNGKKTFFKETHNIYQVRSNQFPLLFESFVGVTKYFLEGNFFWFVSFFSLVLSLFLIFFIVKSIGYPEFFSMAIYALTPLVLFFISFFTVENFLSLFFLGSVFFILNYFKNKHLFFISLAGFFSGLMFLTKFTGAIFFIGLLLFLFYKKDFKAALTFGVFFVLVSCVFFVLHFELNFDDSSVGGYGQFISQDLFSKIFLNIVSVFNVLFHFFYHNYYLFFIPFLFFIGLLWRDKKELNFLMLFFISASLFLFVIFINGAQPNLTGFPRYFIPIYSLICIFSGIQLKKILLLKNKLLSFFVIIVFILLLLFSVIPVLGVFHATFVNEHSFAGTEKIKDNSDIIVWFVDGGALSSRFEEAILYDYTWHVAFEGNPCDFLKENKIDYVVYFHFYIEEGYSRYLGNFRPVLRESLVNGQCSELIYDKELEIFKINHAK